MTAPVISALPCRSSLTVLILRALTRAHPQGVIDHPTVVWVAADPGRAHLDRLDQQVTEPPVRVRHAGLGDALHGILHDGGRGLPAKALAGGPDPAGEPVGPLGGLRHLRQDQTALLLETSYRSP